MVLIHIRKRTLGHAAFHGSTRHGRGHNTHQARIKRLGNKVVRPERQLLPAVGLGGLGACGGAGKLGNSVDTSQLHRIVDLGRTHVQRTAEDERETQHVVDLVGEIRPARRNQRVRGHGARGLWINLGVGVGQRKNNRLITHLGDHLGFQNARARQPKEHIRAVDHLIKRAQITGLCVLGLLIGHLAGAAFVNQSFDVAQPHVFAFHAQFQQHVQTGNARSTATGRDDLDVLKLLTGKVQRVCRGGPHNNGCAVLIVVENRDVHPLAAQLFDDKTIRRLDVLKVNRAKRRLKRADNIRKFFGVWLVQLNVKTIDVGEFLEQDRFALHHGF